MPRILFVFSSGGKNLVGGETGWWVSEAAHPYHILSKHFDIEFAAPKGPNPQADPLSVKLALDDEIAAQFLQDESIKSKLASAMTLEKVDPSDYVAVFYPGGHGPVLDLAQDPVNAKIASTFFQSGKITAAVCHGPAALIGAVDANGKSIFEGRAVNSITNAEEIAGNWTSYIPFMVEDKIKELGGKFESSGLGEAHVTVADNLITGQNPNSATKLGEEILARLTKA